MNAQIKNPHGQGVGLGNTNSQISGLSPLEAILPLLDRVRKSGKGYICRCPAHADRSPSLSITEVADGRVLLRCFSGCGALSIVQALGLELSDLFPRRHTANMTPQQRSEARQWAKHAGMVEALDVLALEVEIILIGGRKSVAGTVRFDDLERMVLAVKRIQDVKGVLNGR